MGGTITGSNPGWVAGYVPPAGEWNHWLSQKLDVDDPVLTGGPFLPLAGGTVTGTLLLPAPAPTQPNQAVPKSYVDSLTFAVGPFMPTSGGTFTGPVTFSSTLTLMGNPSGLLDAAPKQYVDAVGQTANSATTVANAAVRRAGDTMTGLLVLSADPVNALGAVTKQYADTKLPLAGGTVTGNLSVAGALTAGNGLYSNTSFFANAFNGYEWSFSVDGNGSKYQSYRTGWTDTWNGSNGARSWNAPSLNLMTLDGSGNLSVVGQMSANTVVGNTVYSNGNASVAGTLATGAVAMGPWVFYNNGNQIQQHTTGWYDEWVTANGQRNWVGGGVIQMTLDPAGNLANHGVFTSNEIFSNDTVQAKTGLYAANNQMFIGQSGTSRIMQFGGNWYLAWDTTNGTLQWVGDMSPPQGFWFWRTSDRVCFNALGATGGAQGYQIMSDERVKADIVPASCGLAEIMRIEPIEFDRIFNDGRKVPREIGFSAQQLRDVLPLAVKPMGITLADGSGGLDDDEPTLAITIDPVVAALVNATKTLAAEVAALKARLT